MNGRSQLFVNNLERVLGVLSDAKGQRGVEQVVRIRVIYVPLRRDTLTLTHSSDTRRLGQFREFLSEESVKDLKGRIGRCHIL